MKRGMVAGVLFLFVAGIPQALAAVFNSVSFFTIPTLDDVGLVGLTIVVAIAGGVAARRRKRK